MTSMAIHNDQDFSFPKFEESSAAADLFVSSSPSLWRIPSLDSVNFFQDGDNISSPSPSPQVHGLEHGKERPSGACESYEDGNGSGGGHHDRTETMDPLWEEFNFSEELLRHRVPSNLSSGPRGLDQLLYPESCATEYNYSTSNDRDFDEKGEEAGYGIPFQLQPLDMSKKISTSSSGGSSWSISNSSKRQRRRAVMLKMVRRLLWLHKLARHNHRR